MSSAYSQTVLSLLQADGPASFHRRWAAFHRQYHPDQSHADAFVRLAAELKAQIDPAVFLEFVFHFFENRDRTAAEDFVAHRDYSDYAYFLNALIGTGIVSPRDSMALSKALSDRGTENAWQYDKFLNEKFWLGNEPGRFNARIRQVQEQNGPHSIYCCVQTDLSDALESANGPALTRILPSAVNGTECRWQAWSQRVEWQGEALSFQAPFSIDTNHYDEVGIFLLWLSGAFVDASGDRSPVSLDGAEVLLDAAADGMEGGWTLHLGISSHERTKDGAETGRSTYWLQDQPIALDPENPARTRLTGDESAWTWMGRNRRSTPYHAYCRLPLKTALTQASGLFFLLKPRGEFHLPTGGMTLNALKVIA